MISEQRAQVGVASGCGGEEKGPGCGHFDDDSLMSRHSRCAPNGHRGRQRARGALSARGAGSAACRAGLQVANTQ